VNGMTRLFFLWVLIVALCVTGCGRSNVKPLDKTYPVHGRVTFKDGKPATDGYVQFYPEKDRWATTTGALKSDGSYSLTTTRDRMRSDGALPGVNQVSISITPTNKVNVAPMGQLCIIKMPTPKTVEEKDNEINFVLK
jgi:hypothetical protein